MPYDRPFDFSEKCNIGVLSAQGDVVVLLNDDIEVVSDDFVTQLVAPLFEDGVGMTGGAAAFPDGRVQNAGLAIDQRLEHVLRRGHIVDTGPFLIGESARATGSAASPSSTARSPAISAACLAIKRSLYLEVGGLSRGAAAELRRRRPLAQGPPGGLPAAVDGRARRRTTSSARSRQPLVYPREARALSRRWLLPNHDRYLPYLPESRPPTGGKHPAREARARARWQ